MKNRSSLPLGVIAASGLGKNREKGRAFISLILYFFTLFWKYLRKAQRTAKFMQFCTHGVLLPLGLLGRSLYVCVCVCGCTHVCEW